MQELGHTLPAELLGHASCHASCHALHLFLLAGQLLCLRVMLVSLRVSAPMPLADFGWPHFERQVRYTCCSNLLWPAPFQRFPVLIGSNGPAEYLARPDQEHLPCAACPCGAVVSCCNMGRLRCSCRGQPVRILCVQLPCLYLYLPTHASPGAHASAAPVFWPLSEVRYGCSPPGHGGWPKGLRRLAGDCCMHTHGVLSLCKCSIWMFYA